MMQGIPGSGKSVIAAQVINQLSHLNPSVPVLFFFFRQIIDANHEPVALLRDWLDQVLDYSPPLQKQLKEHMHAGRSVGSMTMEDHWSNLRLAFANLPGKVFCVADALDEMSLGNDAFLAALGQFTRWRPDKVKVLITSRPVPSVEGPLRKSDALHIRLDEKMVDMDIASYVHQSLQNTSISNTDRARIKAAVPGRANGLFLYAKLAMDSFLEPAASVDSVLEALPTDLNELYTSLLREHARRSGVSEDLQLLILQWVTHATRPLRLLEIAEMINATQSSMQVRDLRHSKDIVRAAAGPLLEILPDETLCVIHHSFTEYLRGSTRENDDKGVLILHLESTHENLAHACVMYLQAGCLSGIGSSPEDLESEVDEDEYEDYEYEYDDGLDSCDSQYPGYSGYHKVSEEELHAKLGHPFMAYAVDNWYIHAERSMAPGNDQVRLNRALDSFLGNEQQRTAWATLRWGGEGEVICGVTPLHIAARNGLTSYARHLLLANANLQVDACDADGRTALWWAAKAGHADIVRLLLAHGANLDQEEKRGLKPLHVAAGSNNVEAVKALLQAGVDPLTTKMGGQNAAPGTIGSTALSYACSNGHLETLEAFLPFLSGIDVVYQTLAWAAEHGQAKLVKRLIQYPGIDVNAKIGANTALVLACGACDCEAVTALIEAGADPTILCESRRYTSQCRPYGTEVMKPKDPRRGDTALHALFDQSRGRRSRDGHGCTVGGLSPEDYQYLINLLLRKGANVNHRTQLGQNALHLATRNLTVPLAAVKLLLEAGADVNAVDDDGRAPIHGALRSPDVLSILIDYGADINKQIRSDGMTALHCMIGTWQTDALIRLLEYQPDLSLKDNEGNGVLHHAFMMMSLNPSIIQTLIDAGADPNGMNHAGETCLHVMNLYSQDPAQVLNIMIKAGADLNLRDNNGATVLFKALQRRNFLVPEEHKGFRLLIQSGADISVRDFKGRTMLHEAVAGQQKLDFFVGLGLDPAAVDYQGNSLLHELTKIVDVHNMAFQENHALTWKHLVDLGVQSNRCNNLGRTPLHMLCSRIRDELDRTPSSMPLLDLAISESKNINSQDRFGLSALHLAVTVSEHITKKLLLAGANPMQPTFERLTPLHLAARARQCNSIGLLLEYIGEKAKEAVNAQDQKGRTPLYYACRSGKVESVQLLVDAGASTIDANLFQACAEFEEEQTLWEQPRHTADDEANINAGGLTIQDTSRPNVSWCFPVIYSNALCPRLLPYDSTRLDEIVGLLLRNGVDREELDSAINYAATTRADYAFACLVQVQNQSSMPAAPSTDMSVKYFEIPLRAAQDAQVQAALEFAKANPPSLQVITNLLKRRQYHVVEALSYISVEPMLDVFVYHGFHDLLDRIGTSIMQKNTHKSLQHYFDDTQKSKSSLLLRALRRSEPNMNVVRLLIDKFHIDVNIMHCVGLEGEQSPEESALHHVARGQHWWHVALALPFLLEHGAHLESKHSNMETPLHVALSSHGMHSKDAARALILAGADVNAVMIMPNGNKLSCLALAGNNTELISLLTSNGALVTPDALYGAVDRLNVDVLGALLEGGSDPNISKICTFDGKKNVCPLLFHAAASHGAYRSELAFQKPKDAIKAAQIVKMLLSRGADPFATFRRKTGHEELTILHELIRQSEVVHPFLMIPGLDFNRRDARGRTVFHAICQNKHSVDAAIDVLCLEENEKSSLPSFLDILVDGGADALTCDNDGRNALHHRTFMDGQSYNPPPSNFSDVFRLAAKFPSLVDQQDREGKTPLHFALDIAAYTHDLEPAKALLDAGADFTITDNDGNTALHILAYRLVDCSKILSLFNHLKDQGLDINARNAHGETPVFNVFKYRSLPWTFTSIRALLKVRLPYTDLCRLLGDAGADLTVRDNRGTTLLHVAASGYAQAFEALMDFGLDPLDEDDEQRTAVDIAIACENRAVRALFEKKAEGSEL